MSCGAPLRAPCSTMLSLAGWQSSRICLDCGASGAYTMYGFWCRCKNRSIQSRPIGKVAVDFVCDAAACIHRKYIYRRIIAYSHKGRIGNKIWRTKFGVITTARHASVSGMSVSLVCNHFAFVEEILLLLADLTQLICARCDQFLGSDGACERS